MAVTTKNQEKKTLKMKGKLKPLGRFYAIVTFLIKNIFYVSVCVCMCVGGLFFFLLSFFVNYKVSE